MECRYINGIHIRCLVQKDIAIGISDKHVYQTTQIDPISSNMRSKDFIYESFLILWQCVYQDTVCKDWIICICLSIPYFKVF